LLGFPVHTLLNTASKSVGGFWGMEGYRVKGLGGERQQWIKSANSSLYSKLLFDSHGTPPEHALIVNRGPAVCQVRPKLDFQTFVNQKGQQLAVRVLPLHAAANRSFGRQAVEVPVRFAGSVCLSGTAINPLAW
jgi:hypothetical protein